MEDDKWSFGGLSSSSSSRSYKSAFRALSDLCIDFEEADEDDDLRAEYPCPFCDEDFDLVELCCHIEDEHPYETKPGVCPVCVWRVGADMVGHIIKQHGSIVKSLHRLKHRKGGSDSTLSFLKKELKNDSLQSLFASKLSMTSTKMAPDPLVSFLSNGSSADNFDNVQPESSLDGTVEEKSSDEFLERNTHSTALTDEEHMEKSKRSKFVQGLVLSTIFRDS